MFIMTKHDMQIFAVSSQSPAGFGHIAKTSFNSTCFVLQRKNKTKNNSRICEDDEASCGANACGTNSRRDNVNYTSAKHCKIWDFWE